MKYLAPIIITVAVPILLVVLGLIWLLEKALGFRYEGFLTGKTCGWHKIAVFLLFLGVGTFAQSIRREGDCVYVTFYDLPLCSQIEYSADLTGQWFRDTRLERDYRTPFVEMQIKATSTKSFWRLRDCATPL